MLNVSISDLKNLFPTKVHLLIFIGYMSLFINQGKRKISAILWQFWACVNRWKWNVLFFFLILGLLVTASKNKSGQYDYNTTTVVMFTEALKLIVACVLQLRE